LTDKIRLRNDLSSIEWDVKLYRPTNDLLARQSYTNRIVYRAQLTTTEAE